MTKLRDWVSTCLPFTLEYSFVDKSNENQKSFSRDNHYPLILRDDRFVDLVDALFMYVSASREEMKIT